MKMGTPCLFAHRPFCLKTLPNTQPALSQNLSLKIRRSGNFVYFRNVVRRILRLRGGCERVGRYLNKKHEDLQLASGRLGQNDNLYWVFSQGMHCESDGQVVIYTAHIELKMLNPNLLNYLKN